MPHDHETEWQRAKAVAHHQYPKLTEEDDRFWRLVQGIYQNMVGGKTEKGGTVLVVDLAKGAMKSIAMANTRHWLSVNLLREPGATDGETDARKAAVIEAGKELLGKHAGVNVWDFSPEDNPYSPTLAGQEARVTVGSPECERCRAAAVTLRERFNLKKSAAGGLPLVKAHVKGHTRLVGGRLVYVKEHFDRRPDAGPDEGQVEASGSTDPDSIFGALAEHLRPGAKLTPPAYLAGKQRPKHVVHPAKHTGPSAFVAFQIPSPRGRGKDEYHNLEAIMKMLEDGWKLEGEHGGVDPFTAAIGGAGKRIPAADLPPLVAPALVVAPGDPVQAVEPVLAGAAGPHTPAEVESLIRLEPLRSFPVKSLSVKGPRDAADLLDLLRDNAREANYVIALDAEGRAVHLGLVGVGNAVSAPYHAREALQAALLVNAKFVIFTHNHPMGSSVPSRADIVVTEHFAKAAAAAGLTLVDHVIVSQADSWSMVENHSMAPPDQRVADGTLAGYGELAALPPPQPSESFESELPVTLSEVDLRWTRRNPGHFDAAGQPTRIRRPEDAADFCKASVQLQTGKLAVIAVDIQNQVQNVGYVEEPSTNPQALADVVRVAALSGAHHVYIAKQAWEGDSLDTHTQRRTVENLLQSYDASRLGMPITDVITMAADRWYSFRRDGIIKSQHAVGLILKAVKHEPSKAKHVKTTVKKDGGRRYWYEQDGHYYSSDEPPADAGPDPKAAQEGGELPELIDHVVQCSESGLGYRVKCTREEAEKLFPNNLRKALLDDE